MINIKKKNVNFAEKYKIVNVIIRRQKKTMAGKAHRKKKT